MNVNVMLDAGAYMPEKAHETDAGFDLRTHTDFIVEAHDSAVIDTGVHVEIPVGYAGMLKSKSGLNVNAGITSEGVIDAGYTGSIRVKLYNNGADSYVFKAGDKITQLVIMPIPCVTMNLVNCLDATERGNNGFGSTGR